MTPQEGLARLQKLMDGATGHIKMKLDDTGRTMMQICTGCGQKKETVLEISAAGDERLFTDLEAFQAEHRHEE